MIRIIADSMGFGTRITTIQYDKSDIGWGCLLEHPLVRTFSSAGFAIATATEWDQVLKDVGAELDGVATALAESEAKEFEENDWHLPFYKQGFWQETGDGTDVDGVLLADAQAESLATLGTAEHQATPMGLKAVNIDNEYNLTFDEGVTHFDRKGRFWSDNLVNWVQLNQMGSYHDDITESS